MNLVRRGFTLPGAPAGMALTAARPGEQLGVLGRGFFTSDDGAILYTFLDSFFDAVIGHAGLVRPEDIQTAFVSILDGTSATLILNPPVQLDVIGKVAIQAGRTVGLDDVADIAKASIPGFSFPDRGAFAYIFQHGWRRGFYFDLTAHAPGADQFKPLGDIGVLLGSLHAALMLRDRVRMTPDMLGKMARAGWFPFTRLTQALAMALYQDFVNDWDYDKTEQRIVDEVGPQLPAIVDGWASRPAFAPHLDVLRTGARLFAAGEYVAAASTIMPKVEGVLRHLYNGQSASPRAPELRRNLVGRVRASVGGYTALLPEAFAQYLEAYYYASFELGAGDVPPSRHAFLHGVGPDEELKKPAYALRLFLTLDQLFFCVSRIHAPTSRRASGASS